MARLLTSGFEWNDTSNVNGPDPNTVGAAGISIVTSSVRSGTYAMQIVSSTIANKAASFSFTAVTQPAFYRVYVNFSSITTAATGKYAALLGDGGGGTNFGIVLNGDGNLQFFDTALTGATFTPSTGVWYRLEMSFNTTSQAWEWRVDGSTIATGTTTGLSQGLYEVGDFFHVVSPPSYTALFDDAALNDASGAAQNSWPGNGKVVLLAPASDNAKGTGWTNDAAGASNFFDAVNNEPPVGIADTTAGSGLHQIRNATSNANVNYDANLSTYTAAGLGVSDTVNVLVPVVATAAPVTTSSKQGTVGVSANPVIANVALGAGGTAGAFWAGVAAATYPTGWKWSFGTATYAPSVTLGNAPVMRITQVTSSTRIAMVCAMGMYVDYTPAVLAPPELGLGLVVT